MCFPATCAGKSNVNPKSSWKCHLAQELLPGTHGSAPRGDFDKINTASALAGLVLEGVSLTQPKLSPSFGFSSASAVGDSLG